jgi:hypothetical protein
MSSRQSCPEAGRGQKLDTENAKKKQRDREEERPDPRDDPNGSMFRATQAGERLKAHNKTASLRPRT